jgi:DNA-directed RNA polymerase I and III subunit RPAC1
MQCWITVVAEDEKSIEFDLVGTTAEVANALRRIILSEVPTMAIETCRFHSNNTGVSDETLAHRLGLVPIKIMPTDHPIVLQLDVECKPQDGKLRRVFSSDLTCPTMHGVGPTNPDIIIAKLSPGQKLSIDMECVRGTGSMHAKWSPVCSAAYRLLPQVILKREFSGESAQRLQTCFAPGVIELDKNGVARVSDARKCTFTTEIKYHPDLAEHVVQKRVEDHYIFYVESIGTLAPREILHVALLRLCEKFNNNLKIEFSD